MRQDVSQKTVAVLGASGVTGRHVVSTAAERGHDVVALVRRPGAFAHRKGVREVIWSDVAEAPELAGVDVVISALGGADKGPTTVCADGIRSVVAAMREVDVTRLIAVSAHGVLETHDGSLYSRAVWSRVAERMRDKEEMEKVVAGSDVDWTLVRPPALSNAGATGEYRTGVDLPIRLWSSIGRADLAAFLVDEAENPRYVRARPRITR